MTKTTTKRKNPNDSTFRNINALKKRVTALETRWAALLKMEFYDPKNVTLGQYFKQKGVK